MSLQIEESLMKVLKDVGPPPSAPLAAKYKRSFAFPSMNERVPVIITKIIDYIVRDKKNIIQNFGENAEEEIKAVIGEISELKNHLQTAKCFQEFSSDSPDTELWNSEIRNRKSKGDPLNYYESDWLFSECYLYRRIKEIFATKKLLCNLDPFSYQKEPVLSQSIEDLGPHLRRLIDQKVFDKDHQLSPTDIKSNLSYLIKCSLWANRMDMSLSGGNTDVALDVIDLVHNWDSNILVDHTDQVSSIVLGKDPLDVVDLVTDNGAIELLNDLILADFLVTRCRVKKVHFRVKPMYWYVSDVTQHDFHSTINIISRHSLDHYKFFGTRWRSFIDQGIWEVSSETFWCLGLPYSDMARVDPAFFAELKASPLVIFKGDLNYRKLVQDRNWKTTTSFSEALGDFSPVVLLALRTCKADTIAGLEPGTAENISKQSPDWMVSGEYGLIQFNSGQ
uniref:Sugar phosphate phosphatase n=1 Tax=Lygus hesperus TaxID=30085 RepID=A0A0A9X5P6_LYGHE